MTRVDRGALIGALVAWHAITHRPGTPALDALHVAFTVAAGLVALHYVRRADERALAGTPSCPSR